MKSDSREHLSLSEAIRKTGFSRRLLKEWISEGFIRTVHVGRRDYLFRPDLDRIVTGEGVGNFSGMSLDTPLSERERSRFLASFGNMGKLGALVLIVSAVLLLRVSGAGAQDLQYQGNPDDSDVYRSEIHHSFQNLVPDVPPSGATTVFSRWVVGLYGVLEADGVFDSTRSFSNWPFNAGAASKDTISGTPAVLNSLSSPQFGFDVNNSRFGIEISSPRFHGYKVRGLLEMDFLSVTGDPAPVTAGWNNPSPHLRQLWVDIETSEVGDLLLGKYWSLFGWQPYNLYSSVQIAVGPGEAYGLFPQARWYKIARFEGTLIEPAIAIESQEPNFGLPSIVEGLKWAFPSWSGETMIGATGKGIQPASVGFSAIETPLSGWIYGSTMNGSPVGFDMVATACALDVFLPVIPARYGNPDNTLAVSGEFTSGAGDGFQFPGLTWGLGSYGTGTPGTVLPFGTGIANGNSFVPIDVQSWNVNVQYFFGDHARTSVGIGIADVSSVNLASQAFAVGPELLGGGSLPNGFAKYLLPWNRNTYVHADFWHDFLPSVRMGLEAGQYNTAYVGGEEASDTRILMGWYFLW